MVSTMKGNSSDDKRSRLNERIRKAKSKVRTEIDPDNWDLHLYKTKSLWGPVDQNIARIDYNLVTEHEFYTRYERVPVVIENACQDWPAMSAWEPAQFVSRFAKCKFKVGQDDDGKSVYLKLKYFDQYCRSNTDDSPLYIFDTSFPDRKSKRGKNEYPLRTLLDEYKVPMYFRYDLFQYISHHRRPPYRWIVIGPERSGTGIHVDPLGTSAWNSVLYGHKRWCIFPPHVPKHVLNPRKSTVYYDRADPWCILNTIHDHEAATWFNEVYPNLIPYKAQLQMIELIQNPGETVYIPGGWFHVVCNLSMSVAITQNFCSASNFERVYLQAKRSRPKMTAKWRRNLEAHAAPFASSDPPQFPTSLNHAVLFPYLVHAMRCLDTVPPIPVGDSSSCSNTDSSTSDSESDE